MSCERSWQARAIDEGRLGPADVLAFERHVRVCTTCHQVEAALAELRALTGELVRAEPNPSPTELDLRRLRARILRDAMSPARSAARAFAVLAAAAVTVAVFAHNARPWWTGGSTDAFAASVVPEKGAAWTQARHDGIERVVLTEGDVTLHVRKQGDDERFLVVVPDGEVEVRGTTFEVAVHAGQTTRVHVDEGVVEVRVRGSTKLAAGESWPRMPSAPAGPSDTLPVASAVPSSSRPTEPEPRAGSGPSSHASPAPLPRPAPPVLGGQPSHDALDARNELPDYERAVTAYRAGRFEHAAELLHAFSLTHPSSSFLDDASFLEASSLANAGRSDAAALLAERHLARFPSSFHRKEAAILVARLRRDRGDCDGARSAVASWLGETPRDPRVGAALGGCIAQ
jgi:TolA-binding protein